MKRINDHIVIDADVARSSGETEHPISSSCRKVLNFVKDRNGKVVFCYELREEWRHHASRFAKRWMVNMVSRKKIVDIDCENIVAKDLACTPVREPVLEVAKKDSHLVNSAINSSACIASRDDKAKLAFVEASDYIGYVKNIVWFNPVRDEHFLEEHWGGQGYVEDRFFLKKGNGPED